MASSIRFLRTKLNIVCFHCIFDYEIHMLTKKQKVFEDVYISEILVKKALPLSTVHI